MYSKSWVRSQRAVFESSHGLNSNYLSHHQPALPSRAHRVRNQLLSHSHFLIYLLCSRPPTPLHISHVLLYSSSVMPLPVLFISPFLLCPFLFFIPRLGSCVSDRVRLHSWWRQNDKVGGINPATGPKEFLCVGFGRNNPTRHSPHPIHRRAKPQQPTTRFLLNLFSDFRLIRAAHSLC